MNECRHKDDCINYGSFDYCIRENTVPVICCHYIKEHPENPLSTISTPALVKELCSRVGVVSHDISESYGVSIIHEIECFDPVEVSGPAKIIVVRGME